METKYKNELKEASKLIRDANLSFNIRDERKYFNSALEVLDKILRQEPDYLPAKFLKARATREPYEKRKLLIELLNFKPKTRIRTATLYFDLAETYYSLLLSSQDISYKEKAIYYADKSISTKPDNNQIFSGAVELLIDLVPPFPPFN